MPQVRTLLQQAGGLTVERVVKHATTLHWSPTYEAATPRLVLPAQGAVEFQLAGRTVVLDGTTVLGLPGGLPYQMKPCGAKAQTSIVVSAQQGAALWQDQAHAWFLAPRSLWRLRRHWRALARGGCCAVPTQTLLQAELRSAMAHGTGRSAAVVQRAQRFMVAQDCADWSLHDVADAACCSLFHLARQFRRHTGLSLHGYRQRLRLAAALQRLEDGERDLAGLAHDLGYSSQSHLGAAFRAAMGSTLAQARLALAA